MPKQGNVKDQKEKDESNKRSLKWEKNAESITSNKMKGKEIGIASLC